MRMTDKKKKRLKKTINQRSKEIEKQRLERSWRNIFIQKGILKEQ